MTSLKIKDEKKIGAFILTDIELSEELMDEGRCCRTSRTRVVYIRDASRTRIGDGKVDAVCYSQTICSKKKNSKFMNAS